ncbi:efflux pump protein [Massarina eburnea CBS 473.64]|uniref:Efflux pump protein n=1 Tax=Massarina eburnea CBS 473.64 TaxID=1395130 RepID=A0A6A6SEK4_9PLEO|nr:efflux pump protein [Massarina eburnea CBS 473.64]
MAAPSDTTHVDSTTTTATTENNDVSAIHVTQEMQYVTGAKIWLLTASLSLVCFLLLLDMSILSTAIPKITSQFHSLPDVGWYSGAYQLANAALQPLTGKLYTHLHKKDVFMAHLFLFELGSLVCGLATGSSMLIGGRTISGMGGAGLMNGAMTILADAAPLEKRAVYTGIVMGFGQIGLVTGPLIGGVLTDSATWRWCFYLNLPIGGIAAVVIYFVHFSDPNAKIPYSVSLFRKVIPQLDLLGFVVFAPACIMFLLALQWGGVKYAWKSGTIVGLFVGAGITAALFAAWETRVGEGAMIPGALLRHRIMLASTGHTVAMGVIVMVGSLWMPMYFQAVKGASPTQSGVDTLSSIISQLVFIIISAVAVNRLGYYLPWATIAGVLTAIASGLMSTMTAHTPTAHWVGYLILLGAGRGSGMQMALLAAQASLPPKLIPVSLAFLIFVQNLMGAVFNIVANTIFTQTLVKKLPEYAPSVSPQAALNAGASAENVRQLAGDNTAALDGILKAYAEGLRGVWLMLAAFGCVAVLVSFGMGWRDVRKKDAKKGEKEEV